MEFARPNQFPAESSDRTEEFAAMEFIERYINNYGDCPVAFHVSSLGDLIRRVCFADQLFEKRILLLYLHNGNKTFSRSFCSYLKDEEIQELIDSSFHILAWDITEQNRNRTLLEKLVEHLDISAVTISKLMSEKTPAIFLLANMDSALTTLSYLHGSLTKENLVLTLKQIAAAMVEQHTIETKLLETTNNDTGIDSTGFHQLMFDQLGDRDYDCFEFNEHQHLKNKISFALYGPPQSLEGYDDKQKKNTEELYKQICSENNRYSKWDDKIVVAFIYNCTEPLQEIKLKRAREINDYNPLTDISPLPVIILRKCKGSPNPCRIFIDHDCRVYSSWSDYLEKNKLPKCKMVVPKGGRYYGNADGEVQLVHHFSPACHFSEDLLRGTDVASTVVGIGSGGVFAAALIPAITIGPAALLAAGVCGIGVGVYSIVRSSFSLIDRSRHRQDMSITNSEARGAYINIAAGSLGFVGAGATTALSTLSARGVNVGQGARLLVNGINGANIAAGGIGIVNSTYEILYQLMIEKQNPSSLTILQLTASVLFFGNAVYNFRTAGTIIEESQTRALNDIQDNLRSNRHRKTFNKLLKETVRQNGEVKGRAEVISSIRNMNQLDDVMAVLTRSNKSFNKDGIRFSANNGEIQLNGINVDLLEYGGMDKLSQANYLLELPTIPESATPAQVENVSSQIKNLFNVDNIMDAMVLGSKLISGQCDIQTITRELLCQFTRPIQDSIISFTKKLVSKLEYDGINIVNILKDVRPQYSPLYTVMEFVISAFKGLMNAYEENYQKNLITARQEPDFDFEVFHRQYFINPQTAIRAVNFFEKGIHFANMNIETFMRTLMTNFLNLLSTLIWRKDNQTSKKEERRNHQGRRKNKNNCKVCGGYYYVK